MQFLVFALAALDAVSASIVERAEFDTKDVWTRPEGDANQIADLCHPNPPKGKKWKIPGSDHVPPCLSEQFISRQCEEITRYKDTKENSTDAQMVALKQCLTEKHSSYYDDVKNCMRCKQHYKYFSPKQYEWFERKWEQAMEVFLSEKVPVSTPWTYVQAQIGCDDCVRKEHGSDGKEVTLTNWDCFTSLAGRKNYTEGQRKAFGEPEYVQTKPQNIGTFEFEGKTYTEPLEITQEQSDANQLVKVKDIGRCDILSTGNNALAKCKGTEIFIRKTKGGFESASVAEQKPLDLDNDSEINNIVEVPQQEAEPVLNYLGKSS